ncbi:hypothetical protein HAX54_008097 [Datura stramonium]|uniref:DUF4283 domain-containing protein n=1 Tax=Datura stramonium TaxID=4076 RepID=A0ABS8TEC2_DATST|nr:hypothetical protein [Datura stramonium]
MSTSAGLQPSPDLTTTTTNPPRENYVAKLATAPKPAQASSPVYAKKITFKGKPSIFFKASDYYRVMKDKCRFTLIGKFSMGRPKLENIRIDFKAQFPVIGQVRVEVDLRRPLPNFVWVGVLDEEGNPVGGYEQNIEYEGTPDYCLQCKHHGHSIHDCIHAEKNKEKGKKMIQDTNKGMEGQKQTNHEKEITKEPHKEGRKHKKHKNSKQVKQVYKVTKDNNKSEDTVDTNKQDGEKDTTTINIEVIPREEEHVTTTEKLPTTSPAVNANNTVNREGNKIEKRPTQEQEEQSFEEVTGKKGSCRRIGSSDNLTGCTISIDLVNSSKSLQTESTREVEDDIDESLQQLSDEEDKNDKGNTNDETEPMESKSDDENAKRLIHAFFSHQQTPQKVSIARNLSPKGTNNKGLMNSNFSPRKTRAQKLLKKPSNDGNND